MLLHNTFFVLQPVLPNKSTLNFLKLVKLERVLLCSQMSTAATSGADHVHTALYLVP